MGLLAAAVVLATQTKSGQINNMISDAPPSVLALTAAENPAQPSQSRLDEIWGHVDNRVIRQLDLWFDDGEFPRSVELLKVEYAYDPDDYEVATNLGWMLENTDRMPEAKQTYTEFGQVHPKDGNAQFPLGLCYYMTKEYTKAIAALEPSLKLNPGPNTYRILAKCYERIKKYDDAIRIWEAELKRFPGEAPATDNINRVKAKMKGGGKK